MRHGIVTVTKDVTSDELLEISLMFKFCNNIVIDEDKVCCMCGTTKFIGRVNTGEKYYCNTYMKKINDSGMDYWKPCTQVEFFESMLSHMRKRYSLKEHLRQIKDKEENNKKD